MDLQEIMENNKYKGMLMEFQIVMEIKANKCCFAQDQLYRGK